MRIAFLILVASAFSVASQTLSPYPYNLAYITGAPYTARATIEMDANGQPRVETLVIARGSDGSTYTAHFSGKLNWNVTIEDVPDRRVISLNPRSHTYTIQPMQPMWSVITAAQAAEALREQQAKPLPGPPVSSVKVLGEQQQMGFTTYGIERDTTYRNGVTERMGSWNTDFGATLSSNYSVTDPDGKVLAKTMTLSDVRREEPDPSLFQIPAGYTEASVPNQANH